MQQVSVYTRIQMVRAIKIQSLIIKSQGQNLAEAAVSPPVTEPTPTSPLGITNTAAIFSYLKLRQAVKPH